MADLGEGRRPPPPPSLVQGLDPPLEAIVESKLCSLRSLFTLRRRAHARNISFLISLRWAIHIMNPVDKTKLSWKSLNQSSTRVSLETYPLYSFVNNYSFSHTVTVLTELSCCSLCHYFQFSLSLLCKRWLPKRFPCQGYGSTLTWGTKKKS